MGIMNAPMMLAASSGDDVDFMVHGLIPLKFFGHKVWITTTHVTTLIVMVFIIVLALIARHAVLHGDEKPSGLQNFVEMVVEVLDNLVKGSMGRHWRPFVNYIGTFVLIQYSAFKTSKLHVFTDLFKPIPILFPINLIGEFATPLSMSLRLFGNIMAGTIMMALWYGLLPWLAQLGIPAFLHMYFDLFSGAIQTFVFAMLTMTFITDKREA